MKTADTGIYKSVFNSSLPAKGESYIDPVFGTRIKRISDATITKDEANGQPHLVKIVPEYSTVCPFNYNSTYLLLQHFSYFGLYDGNGSFIKTLPFMINATSQPRWTTDPNIFTFLNNNRVMYYDIQADKIVEYYKFLEYDKITAKGEADLSEDGHYFPLVGSGGTLAYNETEIFLFDCLNLKKGTVLKNKLAFDSLYVTSDNKVIVNWNQLNNTNRFSGIELFDKDMKFIRQLTEAGGHMDVGRNFNNFPVLYWASGGEKKANKSAVVGVGMDTTRKDFLNLTWNQAIHISASVKNYIFIDVYSSDMTPPQEIYTNEILRINTTSGSIDRLCHHRSMPLDEYSYQPKVTCNREGTKIVYGSNFGSKPWINYSDTYMIDLAYEDSKVLPGTTKDVWRTGVKLGRTIYINDKLVGLIDSSEIAKKIIDKMNQ